MSMSQLQHDKKATQAALDLINKKIAAITKTVAGGAKPKKINLHSPKCGVVEVHWKPSKKHRILIQWMITRTSPRNTQYLSKKFKVHGEVVLCKGIRQFVITDVPDDGVWVQVQMAFVDDQGNIGQIVRTGETE